MTMLPTEGPAEKIDLLEVGEARSGFVTMGIALHAWNGTGAWVGRKPRAPCGGSSRCTTRRRPWSPVGLRDPLDRRDGRKRTASAARGQLGSLSSRPLCHPNIPTSFRFGDWPDLAEQTMSVRSTCCGGRGVPFPSRRGRDRREGPLRRSHLRSDRCVAPRRPEVTPSQISPGTDPPPARPYRTVGLYNFAVATRTRRAISSIARSRWCPRTTRS